MGGMGGDQPRLRTSLMIPVAIMSTCITLIDISTGTIDHIEKSFISTFASMIIDEIDTNRERISRTWVISAVIDIDTNILVIFFVTGITGARVSHVTVHTVFVITTGDSETIINRFTVTVSISSSSITQR